MMDKSDNIAFDMNHDAIAIKLDEILDDVAANLPGMDFDSSVCFKYYYNRNITQYSTKYNIIYLGINLNYTMHNNYI